jgi:hypothetical protein
MSNAEYIKKILTIAKYSHSNDPEDISDHSAAYDNTKKSAEQLLKSAAYHTQESHRIQEIIVVEQLVLSIIDNLLEISEGLTINGLIKHTAQAIAMACDCRENMGRTGYLCCVIKVGGKRFVVAVSPDDKELIAYMENKYKKFEKMNDTPTENHD